MGFKIVTVVAVATLIFPFAFGATVLTACGVLAKTTNIQIEWPSTPAYNAEQYLYASITCSNLTPSCIFVPKSATELSKIVKVLHLTKEKFSVKSGGHSSNPGFSSILNGPLISLKAFNTTVYDARSCTAKIGTGNRWSGVAKALELYGVAVAGGRLGHVGVGGYLLGGGLSYLSTQHGWGANTVVEFDVVLANGDIVKASKTENEDLFNVLKGGGNAFGIVFSVKMNAFPIGPIWGGNMIFIAPPELMPTDAILSNIRNMVEYYPDDRAAIIPSGSYNATSGLAMWLLFLFWDGPTPPAGLFDEFAALAPAVNTFAPTTYYDFVASFDSQVISGGVFDAFTETSPLPNAANGLEVFRSYVRDDRDLGSASPVEIAPLPVHVSRNSLSQRNLVIAYKHVNGLVGQLTLAPIPKRLAAYAKASGGDLMSLDPAHDLVVLDMNFAYGNPLDKPEIDKAIVGFLKGIRERVNGFVKEGKLPDGVYLPLYQNYAHASQDYFGRLRKETREFVRRVQRRYDPFGFFKFGTGGFKV